MHIILTMTMMHDRFLLPGSPAKQSPTELYHWYEGASQFNQTISRAHTQDDLTSSEKDAIWMTAALLGCTSLAQVDGNAPEEVWPLKTPSPTDLDWLHLSEGKKEMWRIADVGREDSSLRDLSTHGGLMDDFMIKTSTAQAFDALPVELVDVCELRAPGASEETNPYFRAAAILGRLMPVPVSQSSILKFLVFLSQMSPDYRILLGQKDPRAVLVLLYFYTRASQFHQWWWWKRANLEGKAMCIFLETYHGKVPGMLKALERPKALFFGEGCAPPGLLGRAVTAAVAADENGASRVGKDRDDAVLPGFSWAPAETLVVASGKAAAGSGMLAQKPLSSTPPGGV
jgi:hypothetical protein